MQGSVKQVFVTVRYKKYVVSVHVVSTVKDLSNMARVTV